MHQGLLLLLNANKIRAFKLVQKCIDKDIWDIFKDYFTIQDYGKEARNANKSLKMPKIRTEYAHKSFCYTGGKIYNELPLKIRKIANTTEYENSLKTILVKSSTFNQLKESLEIFLSFYFIEKLEIRNFISFSLIYYFQQDTR